MHKLHMYKSSVYKRRMCHTALKSEATGDVPQTCVLFRGQQGATFLVLNRSPVAVNTTAHWSMALLIIRFFFVEVDT